ncbi:ACP S-malonyltransferase [Brevibacillus humidisoli]|uniref:ACP S-malonyltransferase n=1 Tax=Brevibacillus humidisoli TaxID=2895522 RepID=UPI001E3234B9|nr:ACP S-malonyltransferase [Brevibacillus humidisoli]
MVQYALAQLLLASGIRPDYVLGTSMGEFVSAAVAEIMSAEELLEMLLQQAILIEGHCQKGAMAAVLHNPSLYEEEPFLHEASDLVSVNGDSHFVISGESEPLRNIGQFLKGKGIASQTLPVSYAFHSSRIDPAEQHYREYLQGKQFKRPTIPFVSGLYGEILEELPRDYFWDVVRKPIQFSKAVQALERNQHHTYLDLGPAGTLANGVKRITSLGSDSAAHAILSPFHQDQKHLQQVKDVCSKNRLKPSRKASRKMTTYLFPGQGSQHKGMGGDLFDQFTELTVKADELLGYSIKELCLDDPNQQLGKTQYTQPALYVVNALTYLKTIKETGKKPDYVAGHSLGEYNALFAAGAFDFETGLRLVIRRGELMSHATGGGMAAVIGLSGEQVNRVLVENGLSGIDIANHNAPSQIVIAGQKDDIVHAKPFFEAAGAAMYIPLNVSGAFHSRYMSDAEKHFAEYVDSFTFSPLTIPVIANISAKPYKQADIPQYLIQQITNPVKWTDSIRYLMGLGEMEFIEIGPRNVLTKLVDTIRKEAEPLVVTDAENVDVEDEKRVEGERELTGASLGDEQFKKDYNLTYAYVAGAMYKGIASERMVVKLGKAGMLGFYGTAGMSAERIERAIRSIQRELKNGEAYGMNLTHNPTHPQLEEELIDLFLTHDVRIIEASAFMEITPALIRYRAQGLSRGVGMAALRNRIIAKISRPEAAEAFLSPAPKHIVEKMVGKDQLKLDEAEWLRTVPMADDVIVEADSGWHTEQASPYALIPAIIKLRDEMMRKYGYSKKIRIGAAGGIGTPEAAVAALMLGADFLVTGSINQCTVEADTSDAVKDLLEQAKVQDTCYAPDAELFELGAKVQVLRKGVFFPARANKLYDLYRQYNTLDEIDENTKKTIEEKYLHRRFEEAYEELKASLPSLEIERAERNPKQKMALLFKWYFNYATRLAMDGSPRHQVNYQIHCGPALGAFNQWVKGTSLEHWRNRHVDQIAEKLMNETAQLMNQRFLSVYKDKASGKTAMGVTAI